MLGSSNETKSNWILLCTCTTPTYFLDEACFFFIVNIFFLISPCEISVQWSVHAVVMEQNKPMHLPSFFFGQVKKYTSSSSGFFSKRGGWVPLYLFQSWPPSILIQVCHQFFSFKSPLTSCSYKFLKAVDTIGNYSK